MDWLADLLFGWFFDLMYMLQKNICVIIDFIVNVFSKLSGIESVTVDGEQTDLLSHFVQSNAIRTAFFGVFLIGVILLCVFVLIAIIRSEYTDGQQKRTKAQILTKAGQSFLIFLLIPFLLAAGIMLTNVMMNAVNVSMLMTTDEGGRALFGGQILVTSGHDAYIGAAASRADIEMKFITGQLDYNNLSVVKQYYDLWHVNFIVGIFSGLILLILFGLAAIRFVQRIFDIILLYVVSPVSVSTIPVDDGSRFKLWREMVVSKVLSAYGIIFAMNLFFMIVPQVSRIQFFENGFHNGLIGLLFIIGGAFAVNRAYMVIAQLTGANAGAQEAQQMISGIHTGARMARGVWRMGAGAMGQVIGGADFRQNQRRGVGFMDNVEASAHGKRNQHVVDDKNSKDSGSKGKNEKNKNTQNGASENRTAKATSSESGRENIQPNATGSENITTSAMKADTQDSRTTGENANVTAYNPSEQNVTNNTDARVSGDNEGDKDKVDKSLPATDNLSNGEDFRSGLNDHNEEPVKLQDANTDGAHSAVAEKSDGQERRSIGQNIAHGVGGAFRLATMPIGVMKDLWQGGVITTAKNMWPRLRNIANGKGPFNRAAVYK